MSLAPVTDRWPWNSRPLSFRAVASAFGIGCTVTFSVLDNVPPTRSVGSSWRVVVTLNPQQSMNTKTPECWSSDPQVRALRVEINATHSLLLAFDQFAFSELKSEGKEQQLRLVFATHDVLLLGHSLRRVETAMQRLELSFLATVSGNQCSLIPDGQPVILELEVVVSKVAEVGESQFG
jgi:hypothetical protein